MIESLAVTVKLCVSIVKLLEEAKHNKKECGSLKRLVETIRAFLQGLEAEAISSAGKEALRHVHEQLQCAQGLLARVANTGPLMSLLSAGDFRREFLHIHRDLSGAFTLLGTGEKLLGQERMQRELSALRAELRSSGSGFFSEQEVIGSSLREVAAACQEQRLPALTVHRLLLEELDQVPEVAALASIDLLQELHQLQVVAMYGSEGQQAACKSKTGSSEKALAEQLCAALAPRAALAEQPLSPSAAAQAPDAYLCPISRDIMLDPLLLVETGQSYEAAHIRRWLEAHSTCPLTSKQLSCKQLALNYALRSSIQQWAEQHGVQLPPAPQHTPLLQHKAAMGTTHRPAPVTPPDVASSNKDQARRQTVLAKQQQQKQQQQQQQQQQQRQQDVKIGIFSNGKSQADDLESMQGKRRIRCTRTSWAVALILLVVAGGAAVGLGVGLTRGAKRGSATTQPTPAGPALVQPKTVGPQSSPAPPQPKPAAPQYPPGSWQAQLEALMAVKEAVDPDSTVLTEWTRERGAHGSYCCWRGIVCVKRPNITSLILRGEYDADHGQASLQDSANTPGLRGTLPAGRDMAGLSLLSVIEISNQPGITGTLPDDWSGLEHLTSIRLSNTSLTGSIPQTWGSWSKLQHLILQAQNLSGELPDSLGNLTSVWVLEISNTAVTGTLPASLGRLAELSELTLNNNVLAGTLPDSWKALTKLSTLDLSRNALNGIVPASWSAMRSLVNVWFSNNQGLLGCLPGIWLPRFVRSPASAVDESNYRNTNISGFCPL